MEIVESILTRNPCYRAGRKIRVQGLMLHSVGCPQPSANIFVHRWNNPDASRACVHAFIDGNTGKIYQTLPWDHRAWHGGGSSNNTHIGVEMCEPGCIQYTGGASFTCSDREAAMAAVGRTYQAAVELFAFLCRRFELNPMADGVIVSHREGHARGIASGHGDPDHLWKGLRSGYTMDGFRADVAAMMEASGKEESEGKEESAGEGESAGKGESSGKGESVGEGKTEGGSIREGVLVKIHPAGVYFSGKAMPSWVKRDRWQIKSVNGDRAVLGKNQAGTHEINSPVHVKYLTVARNTVSENSVSGNAAQSACQPDSENVLPGKKTVEAEGKWF